VPLTFHSLSHGTIAFGFFNIETDLLLLENLFFFAPDFCTVVTSLARVQTHQSKRARLPGYRIDRAGDLGNLMGAIQGTDLGGFIGHVYRLFPFPRNPEDFKQKPYGDRNRPEVETVLCGWARSIRIPVAWEAGAQMVKIADFTFSAAAFRELVAYVWQGGMPGWQDNARPGYVMAMWETINGTTVPLFAGLMLDELRIQGTPEEPDEVPNP
jgi:hypothetical protein